MAADVLAMGTNSPVMDSNVNYVDTDARVGDNTVLAPGFKKHLESYYLKATPEDRARCLELLTALDISEEVKRGNGQRIPRPPSATFGAQPSQQHCAHKQRRPKTAMAALDRSSNRLFNPYNTTYSREFSAQHGQPAQADRPGTSRVLDMPVRDPNVKVSCTGPTTYRQDYLEKFHLKDEGIRSGSASGNRRNNPHPLEAFMVWRFPAKPKKERPDSLWGRELSDEIMDQVIRGQLRSTYQSDYLGIPQGYQVKPTYTLPAEDWKAKVPYTLDSSMRATYQMPNQPPELKGNIQRYGCNAKKSQAALGVVPTISTRHMNLKTRTTYEREYNDPALPKVYNVRDFGKQYGAQSLQRYLDKAEDQDKEEITRMLQTMSVRPPSVARTSSRSSFRPMVPQCTPYSPPTVATPVYN